MKGKFDTSDRSDQRVNVLVARRKAFTAKRHEQAHSSDMLLRMQRYKEKGFNGTKIKPPSKSDVAEATTAPSKKGVEAAVRRGVDFYSILQVSE